MTTLTHGDAQDLLERLKQGWEQRDPDKVLELFREDAEYREHPLVEQRTGSNAIRELWNELAASQAHVFFEPERIWVSGSTVLASWHAAYTRRSDARRIRARGFMTLEVDEDGLIWRFRQWPYEQEVGTDSTFRLEDKEGS